MGRALARNAWYVAAWSDQIEPAQPFAASILGAPVVLWRGTDGTVHALADRCVHRLAPLSRGRCEDDGLRCMYHGLLFDPDGRVAAIPGQDTIPPGARVQAYPVVEQHDWIWLWPGDPDLADPALIPPAVGQSDPDWILGRGHLDYAAGAHLICDNLLDFSHLTYVHAESFGAGPTFAEQRPEVAVIERGVRVSRWFPVAEGHPRNPHAFPIEAYQSYDFLVPGVLLMWGADYPAGTAARLGRAAPDPDEALSGLNFTSQAVTPTQEGQARYFFSWGPHRRHGDAAKRDMMMALAGKAFAEDKLMIEAQARVIDATPDPRIMPTAHDRAITLYNRVVERLARQDGPTEECVA